MAPQGRTRPVASRLSPRASHLTSSGPQTHRHSCLLHCLPRGQCRWPPPHLLAPHTHPHLLPCWRTLAAPPPELPEGVPPHPTPGSIPPSTCTRPAPCQSHPWFLCSEDPPHGDASPQGRRTLGRGQTSLAPDGASSGFSLCNGSWGLPRPAPAVPACGSSRSAVATPWRDATCPCGHRHLSALGHTACKPQHSPALKRACRPRCEPTRTPHRPPRPPPCAQGRPRPQLPRTASPTPGSPSRTPGADPRLRGRNGTGGPGLSVWL